MLNKLRSTVDVSSKSVLKHFFATKAPKQAEGKFIYGPRAIYSALINKKRKYYYHLYAVKSSENNEYHKHIDIINLCSSMNIPITYVSKWKLARLTSLHRATGFVLDCDPIYFDEFDINSISFNDDEHNNKQTQIWLGMEEARTQDNVGSILRSCAYFGIDGILYSTLGSCPLSPIVARSACGALDYCNIKLCSDKDLYQYLIDIRCNYADLKVEIIGLDMFQDDIYNERRKRVDINDIAKEIMNNTDDNKLVIVVVGNEGFGLSGGIRNHCDYLIYINNVDNTPKYIDSLSVNVAVPIALHAVIHHYRK